MTTQPGDTWIPVPRTDSSYVGYIVKIVGLKSRTALNETTGKIMSCIPPEGYGVEVRNMADGGRLEVVSIKTVNLRM
jgi:hypothetical protein